MAEIYVYAPDEEDTSTFGLCGALEPYSCVHTEESNGTSELTLIHPIDPYNRWSFLQVDYLLKADVPVRSVPPISPGGDLITSISNYIIKTGTTKKQRTIYRGDTGKNANKKRKTNVPAGLTFHVSKLGTSRYYGTVSVPKTKKGKTTYKNISGWMDPAVLQYDDSTVIEDDPSAIEQISPSWKIADQLFRIYKVEVTEQQVTVNARHIFYDLAWNATNYTPGENPSCATAVSEILDGCVEETEFSGFSDITLTTALSDYKLVNPLNAIMDEETGLVNLYHGHLVRDNYDFFILSDAGMNRGVRIEYAKNMTGIKCTTDTSNLVTRVIPVGKTKTDADLFLEPGTYNVDGTNVTIPADTNWVDSPHVDEYPHPYIKALTCSSECKIAKSVTKPMVMVRMIREALKELSDDVDLPELTITVDFVSLGDTEEYAQYRDLESIFLYDRVRVRHKPLGIDVIMQVTRVEFDCVTETFNRIELGTVRKTIATTPIAKWQLPNNVSARQLLAASTITADLLGDDVAQYTLVIQSTSGDEVSGTTVLSAHVYYGAEEITDDIDAAQFTWYRYDASGVAIEQMTAGVKSITVSGLATAKRYVCEVEGV